MSSSIRDTPQDRQEQAFPGLGFDRSGLGDPMHNHNVGRLPLPPVRRMAKQLELQATQTKRLAHETVCLNRFPSYPVP